MHASSESHQAELLRKNERDYFQSLSKYTRSRVSQDPKLVGELFPSDKNVLMSREIKREAMPGHDPASHWRFERVFEAAQLQSWLLPGSEEGLSASASSALKEHVLAVGFGEGSALRLWTLSEREEIAASCLAFCNSDSWTFYHIRTRSKFRGRGAAAYLLQCVLAAASNAGVKLVGLSSPGYLIPFHEKNGFKVISFGTSVAPPTKTGRKEFSA